MKFETEKCPIVIQYEKAKYSVHPMPWHIVLIKLAETVELNLLPCDILTFSRCFTFFLVQNIIILIM